MALPTSDPEESFLSDEEEEFCPLCVEEMDISDRNFKPCPCGYQVCQFCYNNIRQNPQLNGKCPACRRPYDDESVEYRLITPEEWKREHAKQARRERERKQREREKKETELSSKKHLSGMRVIQKNLVYIIGLNPNIPIEELHHTLRTDQFFGQYGKIQKIVINRRNNNNGTPGLGVYVTFARKEDAARCIAAVDGMLMDGKYLRAAYGTTKYCSAYLRGQSCPNPNCMFLHEPGEEADSYSRHDLSTIQHVARQDSTNTKEKSSKPATKLYPSNTEQDNHNYPQHQSASHDHHNDHNDRPSALPASVSWATKPSPSVSAVKISQPSFPPLPAAPKPAPVITPPPIVQQKPDLPIVVNREPPKPDQAVKFMEDSLVMLCAPTFNYRLPQDMVKSKKLVEKRPLFAFSSTITHSHNDLNQDLSFLYTTYSPPFVYRPPPEPTPTQIPQDPAIVSQHHTPHSLSPHHLQQLPPPPPPPAPLQNLHQQPPAPSQRQIIQPNVNQSLTQLLDKIDSMRMQTPPPPPPPGLYSTPTENPGHGSLGNNVPSQNSQELLARLMKRDPPDIDQAELLDVEGMAKAFLDEVDPFDENNESCKEESLSKDISCDDSVKTSTPNLAKTPVAAHVKSSTLNTSDVKTIGNKAPGSSEVEVVDSVTKTVDVPATISNIKGANATTSSIIKNASPSPTISDSKTTESNAADSLSNEAKNGEDTDIKSKKRFTKPDQFVDAGPVLTKRQKKKLEQQTLLKESIRVREETQFVSGLSRRRHREADNEEKDDSATSSVVSTPSIPEPEIVRSSIPELPKPTPKDGPVEISKPKKANKKFKKLDLNDLDTLNNAIPEKSEPAWANEKPGVHSVADEVAKLSSESSKSKLVPKKVVASKVSSTPSPVNVSPKETSVTLVKETIKVADAKPDIKAKPVPKLISRDTPTDVVKEVIEQASSSSLEEKGKPSVKAPTKTASKSSDKKVTSEKLKTKEVKSVVVKEAKSTSPVTSATPISKKTKATKQKKESSTGESAKPTESALIGETGLDLDENDELIDTIVDPEFIEDLVNKTLQSTSSTLASLFDASPQFITQDSPTFSSSEFESYTPDTDITAEELSLDALCKLLTPHIEIKGDVSLEQAEECLRQSRKMLESLETSFVNTVKETTTVCKNINKAGKE